MVPSMLVKPTVVRSHIKKPEWSPVDPNTSRFEENSQSYPDSGPSKKDGFCRGKPRAQRGRQQGSHCRLASCHNFWTQPNYIPARNLRTRCLAPHQTTTDKQCF